MSSRRTVRSDVYGRLVEQAAGPRCKRSCARAPYRTAHVVSTSPYWVEMSIAYLIRSGRKIRSAVPLDKLEALCSLLEHAIAHRSGAR